MVRFNGVNHLAFATGNMDETIRYWRDLLGMRLVAGLGQRDYSAILAESLRSASARAGRRARC